MADLEPIPYSDAQDPLDPRAGEDDRDGRRLVELEPAELLRDEIPAGQGLPGDPGQPGIAGQKLLGETVYASLRDIPDHRSTWSTCSAPPSEAPGIVEDAIAIGAPGGVDAARHPQRRGGARPAEAAGIEVIMNRCPKIEFGRLGGELSWSGVNSGIIQNRAPGAALPRRTKRSPGAARTTIATASRPGRSMPAPRPTRPPARARPRSTRRRPMSSTMSTTPPRSSTCTISATSIRG